LNLINYYRVLLGFEGGIAKRIFGGMPDVLSNVKGKTYNCFHDHLDDYNEPNSEFTVTVQGMIKFIHVTVGLYLFSSIVVLLENEFALKYVQRTAFTLYRFTVEVVVNFFNYVKGLLQTIKSNAAFARRYFGYLFRQMLYTYNRVGVARRGVLK